MQFCKSCWSFSFSTLAVTSSVKNPAFSKHLNQP